MNKNDKSKHIVIIVLGDIGRSPRMQYHALSLLEHQHNVTLIGYSGEDLIPQLHHGQYHGFLKVIRFRPYTPSAALKKILLPLYLVLRLFSMVWGLVYALWAQVDKKQCPIDCILVQNPPSIPLLFIAYLYTLTQPKHYRPGLVIDWHNLGFSMFSTHDNHPIRKLAKLYEKYMAPFASGHLCVTKAMKEWLVENFKIQPCSITELYDRPPEFFRPTALDDMHELMIKLRPEMEKQCPKLRSIRGENDSSTILTDKIMSNVVRRKNRPALVVSSTSWTPDEDFSILLDALVKLDEISEDDDDLPYIVAVVTGKGPLKQMYESKIQSLNLKHISILTLWMESQDYPKLLGCADLGISLHVSTSGLDLPMKVLDMFGCEVPVCAINFACLDELVKDKQNGRIFVSSDDLCSQLLCLLKPERCLEDGKIGGDLKLYRENIRRIGRWKDNWTLHAKDMILHSMEMKEHKKID